MLRNKNRVNTNTVAEGKILPNFKEIIQILFTFILTVLAWVIFRAENMPHAVHYLLGIFSSSLFTIPQIFPKDLIIIIIIFVFIEWYNREREHALNFHENKSNSWIKLLRVSGISVVIWAIILWGAFDNKEFIYFQF